MTTSPIILSLSEWKEHNPNKSESDFWDELKLSRERELKFKNRKVKATLTNTVCTASCWNAKNFDCHCSCGGKNHGLGEPTRVIAYDINGKVQP